MVTYMGGHEKLVTGVTPLKLDIKQAEDIDVDGEKEVLEGAEERGAQPQRLVQGVIR